MTEKYFNNKIYYRTNEFQANRLTLVLVHGVCGSSSAWWEYEKIWRSKYNILSLDLRGHGKSKRFTEYDDYSLENFSNDIYELINSLEIKKFVLISHSFGAFVALDFIAHHPKYILASVFLSPNYNASMMPQARMSAPILNLISKIKFPVSQTKERKHLDYLKNYPNSGDFNLKRTIADVSNTSLRSYLYVMRQAYLFNGEAVLAKINFPVLIIHGQKDTIFPIKYGKLMAQKIPGCQMVTLPNISHEIKDNLITIAKISQEIENFLANIDF